MELNNKVKTSNNGEETKRREYSRLLIDVHRISMLLSPLLLAGKGSKSNQLRCLAEDVISAGTHVYTEVAKSHGGGAPLPSSLADAIFVSLSKVMVDVSTMYGSFDISYYQDSLTDVLTQSNSTFSLLDKIVSEDDHAMHRHYVHSALIGNLSDAFRPVWLVHNNLYISGFIDEQELIKHNRVVMNYLVQLLAKVHEVIYSKHREESHHYFILNIYSMSANILGASLADFHSRYMNTSEDVNEYLSKPAEFLAPLEAIVVANTSVLLESVSELYSEG